MKTSSNPKNLNPQYRKTVEGPSSPPPFQAWLHRQLENDEEFRKRVEERLNELQLEQQLIKKRRERGLTQAQLARYARLGQPYLAKLESGSLRNVEVKTLIKTATALGCRLKIVFEDP